MTTLDLLLFAPVPVGHRVRITWFTLEQKTVFSTRSVERAHHPQVEDLDTGIVYAPLELFDRVSAARRATVDEPTATTAEVGPHATTSRELTGTVKACRVGTHHYGTGSERLFKVQTTLTIT